MTEEHTNDGSDNSNSGNQPPPTVDNNDSQGKQEEEKKGDDSKNCDNKQEIPQPLRIKVEKEPRTWKDWKRPEIISAVAAGLSAISIGVASWALFNTIKSVKATQQMVELAKVRDSTTIKQTQDLNKPYLQINYDSFSIKQTGKPLAVVFSIRNIGQYPAMMKEGRFWLMIDSTTPINPFNPEPTLKGKISPINTYAIKEFKDAHEFKSDLILTDGMASGVIQKKTYISFFGEIKYINELTNEPAKYRFNIKFADADLRNYTLVLNENIP